MPKSPKKSCKPSKKPSSSSSKDLNKDLEAELSGKVDVDMLDDIFGSPGVKKVKSIDDSDDEDDYVYDENADESNTHGSVSKNGETRKTVEDTFETTIADGKTFITAVSTILKRNKASDLPFVTNLIFSVIKDLDSVSQHQCFEHLMEYQFLNLGQPMDTISKNTRDAISMLSAKWYLLRLKNVSTSGSKKASDSDYTRMRSIELRSKKVFTQLESPDQLSDFNKALKLRVKVDSTWGRLLRCPFTDTNGNTINLRMTSNFNMLSKSDVVSHNFVGNSSSLADASLSLYQALDSSLSSRLRKIVSLHSDEIDFCGAKLYFFVRKQLETEASSLITNVTEEVRNINSTLKETNYDIPTIAPTMFDRLSAMRDAGGNLTGFYQIIKSAFQKISSEDFKSSVSEFALSRKNQMTGDASDQKGTNVLLLLKEAPAWVKQAQSLDQWDYVPKPTKTKKRKSDDPDDVIAFKASKQITMKDVKSAVASAFNANASKLNSYNKKQPKAGPYKYGEHQWDPSDNKKFDTEDEFRSFMNGSMTHKKSKKYNGVIWHYCAHCGRKGRMGSHKTEDHDAHMEKFKGKGNNTKKNSSVLSDPPKAHNAVLQDIDDGEEASVHSEYNASDIDDL